MVTHLYQDVPESFRAALASLRDPRIGSEVKLAEVPGPSRLAPFSLALTAEILPELAESNAPLATGKFVVLHDPEGQEAWGGHFRVVTFAQAELEPDIGHDPLLPGVAWSWVEEHISPLADARALGGTVTAVASESFGNLQERSSSVELEIRASWTTEQDLGIHLTAWTRMLSVLAGVPPLPAGVARI